VQRARHPEQNEGSAISSGWLTIENGEHFTMKGFTLPVVQLDSARGGSEKPKTKGENATRPGLARALVQEGEKENGENGENGENVPCRRFALSLALDIIFS